MTDVKQCSKCKSYKGKTEFNRCSRTVDKLRYECKKCQAHYYAEFYKANKVTQCERTRAYYYGDIETSRNRLRKSYQINKDKRKKYSEQYRALNKDRIRIGFSNYSKKRKAVDYSFKLITNIRSRMSRFLSQGKSKSRTKALGCTHSELKRWLEGKFTEQMSWDNYGRKGWHIDHIIPLSSAKTEDELLKLCHYTNLQPMWYIDNIRKGNKCQL